MNKAVFLDRDGVVNQAIVRDGKPYPPANIDELVIADGVASALQQLKAAGFLLIIVTNQPDIARGSASRESVEAIHQALLKKLPSNIIDAIYVCEHDDIDHCVCRKPKAGLLLKAAKEHIIDCRKSYMVGDRWRDITAGQTAGCCSIFLNYGYNEKQPENPDYVSQSLQHAADWIISKNK